MKKLDCIMLIDDNADDNFFHVRIINKSNLVDKVISMESAEEAIEYFHNSNDRNFIMPDLILLDINMPAMNGWEFLDEYKQITNNQGSSIIIVMLTTSANPDDEKRANQEENITDFKTKPLSVEMLNDIIRKYF